MIWMKFVRLCNGLNIKTNPHSSSETPPWLKGPRPWRDNIKTHGAPLPQKERDETKRRFNIPQDENFYWPDAANQYFQRNFQKKRETAQAMERKL